MLARRFGHVALAALAALALAACRPSGERPLFRLLDAARTGVTFVNAVPEDTAFNILNYLYYYNGGGVAVGDINNDGLPDFYFTSNRGGHRLFMKKRNYQLEEITDRNVIYVAVGLHHFLYGIGAADDAVTMFLQCGTQWDALAHIFDYGKMWNGQDAAKVSARGAEVNGIEKMAEKIVSRGVLLDIARFKGLEALAPGYAVTEEDLTGCAAAEEVKIGRGDIVLVRTGQLGYCKKNGWGTFAAGDAPGLSFSTADWLYRTEIAGIASDTWGLEVRPNELPDAFQPLHQVMIPNIGLLVGEIFDLEKIADDCAADKVYEFMFVAPPLPITGAVGSPINPQAIK